MLALLNVGTHSRENTKKKLDNVAICVHRKKKCVVKKKQAVEKMELDREKKAKKVVFNFY